MVLIVCAPLNRRVHQTIKWATRDVQRWLALWRRTPPYTRYAFTVSVWCCVFVFGRGVDCGLWCAGCCLFVVGVEGRVRGVDCVCATEPPCASENRVGDAGCAALACALEKNTTLHTLSLGCELFLSCFCFWEWG